MSGANAEIERNGTSYPYFSADINSLVQSRWSPSNNKISMSFEGRRDFSIGGTAGGNDGYPSFYIYFTDWSWAYAFGTDSYDWRYVKADNITIPDPTGKQVYFSIYHMNAGNPGKSYSRKHQIEFGEFSTSFVNGTRYANSNLESSPSYPSWNTNAGSTASGGTLTFTSGSYNSKGGWDLYKTYSGLSTGTNYTWSALVKLGTASNLIITMNNTQAWNTGPSEVFAGLSSTDWTRIAITGTTNTGSFNLHLGASFNTEVASTVQSGGTVFIQDVRLVLSQSQTAISDLMDKNTINASSLTYNNDGTFSFNGSNSITIPFNSSQFTFNDGQTIIIWMKNQSPSSARRNPYDQAYAGAGTITHENDNGFNYFYGTGGSNNTPYTNLYTSFSVVVGETAMVCFTRDTSTVSCYKNGVFSNSMSNPYGSVVTGTNNITIGSGYAGGFAGSIYAVQLYNRALSAAEVLQNFNAQRGIYGL